MSCSHGAGRKMGRKAAIRDLDLEQERKRLDEKGIIHALRGKRDLEEAAGAYKDIDLVMEEQRDLVEIVVKLGAVGGDQGVSEYRLVSTSSQVKKYYCNDKTLTDIRGSHSYSVHIKESQCAHTL